MAQSVSQIPRGLSSESNGRIFTLHQVMLEVVQSTFKKHRRFSGTVGRLVLGDTGCGISRRKSEDSSCKEEDHSARDGELGQDSSQDSQEGT